MFMQLLITTLLLSAADSLNPFVLSQQFVLQGLIKKPSHIWYFIAAVSFTNLVIGLLAYAGFAAFLPAFLAKLTTKYYHILRITLLCAGIAFIALAAFMVIRQIIKRSKKPCAAHCCGSSLSAKNHSDCTKCNHTDKNNMHTSGTHIDSTHLQSAEPLQPEDTHIDTEEQIARSKVRSVTPTALIALGVVTTLAELLTALPYFAYITVTVAQGHAHLYALPALLLYNIIYVLPNIILALVFIKAYSKFNALYRALKRIISKLAPTAMPIIMVAAGVFLILKTITF